MSPAPIEYREYLPPEKLSPFVHCIWTLRAAAGALASPEPVVPDGRIELMLAPCSGRVRTNCAIR